MQIAIDNSVNIYMEYLKLMEDDHFSLECNYHDIYHIVINKLISIVIVIFLQLLSTILRKQIKILYHLIENILD